jgi:hypothetical protein
MHWFRVTGAVISLIGVAIFILAVRRIMPVTNGSAGIGAFSPFQPAELILGGALVVAGLFIAARGGRLQKLK